MSEGITLLLIYCNYNKNLNATEIRSSANISAAIALNYFDV